MQPSLHGFFYASKPRTRPDGLGRRTPDLDGKAPEQSLAESQWERVLEAIARLKSLPKGTGDTAELRMGSGRNDEHTGAAAHHRTAHDDRVRRLVQVRVGQRGACSLFDRVWLPGQQGLVDEEVVGLEQARVGGHEVSGGEDDHVSRHQVPCRRDQLATVAQHPNPQRHVLLQRLDRTLRPVLLEEIQLHRERDDDGDDRKRGNISGGRGHGGSAEQDQNEGIGEAGEQPAHDSQAASLAYLVRPVPTEAPGGVGGREASGAGIERCIRSPMSTDQSSKTGTPHPLAS